MNNMSTLTVLRCSKYMKNKLKFSLVPEIGIPAVGTGPAQVAGTAGRPLLAAGIHTSY